MIKLTTKFVELQIKEPDNDEERKALRRDLISANALMFAAMSVMDDDKIEGGTDYLYLSDNNKKSH
jgi:hypothetical protein